MEKRNERERDMKDKKRMSEEMAEQQNVEQQKMTSGAERNT